MSRVRQGFIVLLVVSCLSFYLIRSTHYILDIKQGTGVPITWPSSTEADAIIDTTTPTTSTTPNGPVSSSKPPETTATTTSYKHKNIRLRDIIKDSENFDFSVKYNNRFRMKHVSHEQRTRALLSIDDNLKNETMDMLSNHTTTTDKLILLLTSWRSGSTFTAEVLASHPGVYYHYEPLLQYDFKDLTKPKLKSKVADIISSLFKCEYGNLVSYLRFASSNGDMLPRNRRLWSACNPVSTSLCYDPMFLTQACHRFPHQLMKTVRLRLDQVEYLFADPDIGPKLHVILLVRDPRGVLNSRKGVKWCIHPMCSEVSHFCHTYEINYKYALSFKEKYPKQFVVLRYEDVARQSANKTHELFQFLGLTVTNSTQDYLTTHTNENMEQPWSTLRKSETRVELWKSKLSFREIQAIQDVCSDMMDNFGYRQYEFPSEMRKDSVLTFNFTQN